MPVKSSRNDTDRLVQLLNKLCDRLPDRSIKVMEVCGTHTVTAQSAGLPGLLPDNLQLISGPGCPVCVTPAGYIDQAARLALERDLHIMTYGDMMRVPGIKTSLEETRRQGGKVSVIYSVNDALAAAQQHPNRKIVFLGVGFETTAPATAFALQKARAEGINNFMVLGAHKTIIPAMAALLNDPAITIDAFLAPGHVSVIIGAAAYDFIAAKHQRPCVVAGFDGEQMLLGLVQILSQLVTGQAKVDNVYRTRVTEQGNPQAQKIINDVFTPAGSIWRGLGPIDQSGLKIRPEWADFDAHHVYNLGEPEDTEPAGCRCAEVLKGIIRPAACKLFARQCTPSAPVGACMVSREGACSAYYRYSN